MDPGVIRTVTRIISTYDMPSISDHFQTPNYHTLSRQLVESLFPASLWLTESSPPRLSYTETGSNKTKKSTICMIYESLTTNN